MSTASSPTVGALLRRSWPFLRRWRTRATAVAAVALALAGLEAVEPLIHLQVIDALGPEGHTAAFVAGVLALAGVVITTRFLRAWSLVAESDVRLGLDEDLHAGVVRTLYRLPPRYHQDHSPTETIERLAQSAEAFSVTAANLLFTLFPTAVYALVAGAIMLHLEWRLALVLFVLTPIPALVRRWALVEATRREVRMMDGFARVYGRLQETLARMTTVHAFARSEAESGRFLSGITRVHRMLRLGARRDAALGLVEESGEVLALLIAMGVGGWFVLTGTMTIGTLVAFLGYITGLFGPVQTLTQVGADLLASRAALQQLWNILDAPDPAADRPDARAAPALAGVVRFERVSVRGDDGHAILRGVSLTAKPGQLVALVGESGSGKSTLLRALLRFEAPSAGRVTVDGHDVRELTRDSVRRQIALVPQETELFRGTLRDNLTLGRPDASPAALTTALRAAQAHRFVQRLPRGLATRLGEGGAGLSGGQRQRLALARALTLEAPILVLDEATSALDLRTERRLLAALTALKPTRTILVAAHRLSTIEQADLVLALHDGRVVARGTHADLVRTSAWYRNLLGLDDGGEVVAPSHGAEETMQPAVAAVATSAEDGPVSVPRLRTLPAGPPLPREAWRWPTPAAEREAWPMDDDPVVATAEDPAHDPADDAAVAVA